jgi:hypothetical protein
MEQNKITEINQRILKNYEIMLNKFDEQKSNIDSNIITINKIEIGLDYLRDKLDDTRIGDIIDSKVKQYFIDNEITDLKEDIMEEVTDSIQEQADEIIKTIQKETPARGTFIDSIKRETKKLIIEERKRTKKETDKIIIREKKKILNEYEKINNEINRGTTVSNGLYYMMIVNIILVIITLIILFILYSF